MKKLILASLTILAVQPAFASLSIECGNGLDKTDGQIKQVEFTLASESGLLTSKEWELYDGKNNLLKNTELTRAANGDINIAVWIEKSAHVGILYTIKDAKNELFTTAVKKNIGGFAGGLKIADYDCTVSAD